MLCADLRLLQDAALEVKKAMSVGSPCESPHPVSPASGASDACADEQLETTRPSAQQVQATREEVQRIAVEVANLSQQDLPLETFFTQFVAHVTTALASCGGIVWAVSTDNSVRTIAQRMVEPSVVEDHQRRGNLSRVIASGQPVCLSPQSHSAELGVENPTDHLLMVVPIQIEGRVTIVVEVFQRPHRGPATERGYLQFLERMASMAEGYLRRRRMRELCDQQEWSQKLQQYLYAIHRHIGVQDTAYTVVNEIRGLVDTDRVTFVSMTSGHCKVQAISGLDSVDRRADHVRQLNRVAKAILKTAEPMWLSTQSDDIPPQIERDWQRYVDISHVRQCAVYPLLKNSSESESSKRQEPFGALVLEQLHEPKVDDRRRQRIENVCRHSALALQNARQYESLFLLPVWRLLGNLGESLGDRHFLRTLFLTILFVVTAVALTTLKTDLTVPVRGKMLPTTRRTVFAHEDGVITCVGVEHGQLVQAGQVLAELRNTDMDVEITTLVGEQTSTRQQILSLQRSLLDDPRLSTAQQNRLNGELLQLQQTAQSIDQQLQLLRQKEQQLIVRADAAGQVVTWHVQENLLHRPIQKGQALMAIVDPTTAWELELYLPARYYGHLLNASTRSKQPLIVSFVLASHPGRQFSGSVTEVDHVAIDREEVGSTVRVRVAIDARQLPELKTDATVVASIHCGRHSVGYAWFHDLIDTVKSRLLMWT